MAEIASAWVSILPSAKGFDSSLSRQVSGPVSSVGSKVGATFGKLFAAAAAIGIGAKAFDFLGDSIAEAREAQKVGAQTEAVIKSTGAAAGLTAEQFAKMATNISTWTGIDDEVIQGGENILATFTNIKDYVDGKFVGTFTAATNVMTDMSVALGQDMKSSAIQVGKALNDPIKGVTALQRVGVSFTEQQREQIATLVENGKTMEAQKLILGELTKEFGGSAQAQATAADKAAVAWGNFKEAVGTALLPVLDKLATFATTTLIPALSAALPKVEAFVGRVVSAVVPMAQKLGEVFGPVFKAIGPAIQTVFSAIMPVVQQIGSVLGPVLDKFGQWLKDNPAFVKAFAVALVGLVAAITLVTAATTAFSIALNSTGIPLVIIAIAALVAGLVIAYQKSETFRNIVQQVGGVLREVGAALVDFGNWIKSDVVPVVQQLAQKVGQNLKPVFEQLGQTFQQDILPAAQKLIAKFREWQPTIERVAGEVLKLVAKLVDLYTTMLGKVLPVVIRFVGWIISNAVPAFIRWVEVSAQTVAAIAKFVGAVIDAGKAVVKFAATVGQKIAQVVAFFMQLPGKIRSAFSGAAGWLIDAGVAIMQGLWDGLQAKWNDVAGWLGGLAGKITDLKGPPEKDAVLLVKAGRLIMGGLEAGLRDGWRSVSGFLTETTRGIGSALSLTVEEFLQHLKDVRGRLQEQLAGMREDFASLRDSIAQAFAPDLFSATNASEFATQANGALGSLFQLLDAEKRLSGLKGLSRDFLNALFASGNTALILDFASNPQSQVRQASRDWLATQSLSNQLGTNVANDTFGKGINKLDRRLQSVEAAIQHVGADVAHALNGAASDGHRRRGT